MKETKVYKDVLYSIALSYSCFGIIVDKGTCIQAPPIARWMIGKKLEDIQQWVQKHNGYMIGLPANLPLEV